MLRYGGYKIGVETRPSVKRLNEKVAICIQSPPTCLFWMEPLTVEVEDSSRRIFEAGSRFLRS